MKYLIMYHRTVALSFIYLIFMLEVTVESPVYEPQNVYETDFLELKQAFQCPATCNQNPPLNDQYCLGPMCLCIVPQRDGPNPNLPESCDPNSPSCVPCPIKPQCTTCPTVISPLKTTCTAGSHDLGTTIDYECAVGHELSGSASLQCQQGSSPDWIATTVVPTCDPIVCPAASIPTISNGVIGGSGDTYNTHRPVTCNTGFHLVDPLVSEIVCQANGMWSSGPVCEATVCDATFSSGTMTGCSNGNTAGSTCTVECDNGYGNPESSFSVSCGNDGEWTPSKACNPVQCSAPPTIAHATVSCSAPHAFMDTCAITCDEPGYTHLVGSNSIHCRASGTWSIAPTCEAPVCTSPPVVNGGILDPACEDPDTFSVGTVCGQSCDASGGFSHVEGTPTSQTCTLDPQDNSRSIWSTSPACVRHSCAGAPGNGIYPATPSNANAGSRQCSLSTARGAFAGDICVYACNTGYNYATPTVSTKCELDGTWATLGSDCQPFSCNDSPIGSQCSSHGTCDGATGTCACETGYAGIDCSISVGESSGAPRTVDSNDNGDTVWKPLAITLIVVVVLFIIAGVVTYRRIHSAPRPPTTVVRPATGSATTPTTDGL